MQAAAGCTRPGWLGGTSISPRPMCPLRSTPSSHARSSQASWKTPSRRACRPHVRLRPSHRRHRGSSVPGLGKSPRRRAEEPQEQQVDRRLRNHRSRRRGSALERPLPTLRVHGRTVRIDPEGAGGLPSAVPEKEPQRRRRDARPVAEHRQDPRRAHLHQARRELPPGASRRPLRREAENAFETGGQLTLWHIQAIDVSTRDHSSIFHQLQTANRS